MRITSPSGDPGGRLAADFDVRQPAAAGRLESRPSLSAKLARMSDGFFLSCTGAMTCAVRSHDQGAWVWRRRS
jgi:hypothetical protein